ncbi:MAG: ComEA family DNA-binding protein, partial [Sphingobacteriales bacterium]
MKCWSLLLFFFWTFARVMAQEREWEIMQEEQSGVEDGQDIEGDMENLEYWRQKKISINKIDLSDLSLFPFISSYQAEQFIIYRRLLGNFIDVMEIQAIPGWDEITIRKFIPFITIADITFSKDQFLKSFREGSHQFIWRSSIKEGSGILGKYQYKTPHFQG